MVKFIESSHEYIDIQDGSKWTGVTTWLHRFQPTKNWDEIAAKYAKKHKRTKEDVQAEWKTENEKAIKRGHLYHSIRERELLELESFDNLPIHTSLFKDGLEQTFKLCPPQKLQSGVYPELFVALKSKKICGQADFVKITEDGFIDIMDYKTSKEIKQNGYVAWDGTEECMLQPFAKLPNTNFWQYAIQLNTYMYIIKKNNPNFKVGKMTLLHIKFDEQDQVYESIPYEIPNLQHLIKTALK